MEKLELELPDALIEFEEWSHKDGKPRIWFTIHGADTVEILLGKQEATKILRVLDNWVSTGRLVR